MGSGSDVGTNNKAVYKNLIEMGDTFDALSDGECVKTCLGYSDIDGHWFRGSMVRDAALDDVSSYEIDGSA